MRGIWNCTIDPAPLSDEARGAEPGHAGPTPSDRTAILQLPQDARLISMSAADLDGPAAQLSWPTARQAQWERPRYQARGGRCRNRCLLSQEGGAGEAGEVARLMTEQLRDVPDGGPTVSASARIRWRSISHVLSVDQRRCC
ncbi:hypothetical protein [Streptomyces sp. NPDC004008]